MRDQRLAVAEPSDVHSAAMALVAPRRWRIVLTVVTFVAATTLELAVPPLLGVVVDEVSTDGGRAAIDRTALALLCVTVGASLLAWLGAVLAAGVGEDVLADLRGKVFDHAVDLPLDTLERAGTGDLLSRVTGDVAALSAAVRSSAPVVVVAGLQLVLTGAALALLSPPLAAASLVAVPVVALTARWYLRRAGAVYRCERKRNAELTATLHESFEGVATVRCLGLGADQGARLATSGADSFGAAMAGVKLRNVLRPGVVAGQFTALGAVVVVGARLVEVNLPPWTGHPTTSNELGKDGCSWSASRKSSDETPSHWCCRRVGRSSRSLGSSASTTRRWVVGSVPNARRAPCLSQGRPAMMPRWKRTSA